MQDDSGLGGDEALFDVRFDFINIAKRRSVLSQRVSSGDVDVDGDDNSRVAVCQGQHIFYSSLLQSFVTLLSCHYCLVPLDLQALLSTA